MFFSQKKKMRKRKLLQKDSRNFSKRKRAKTRRISRRLPRTRSKKRTMMMQTQPMSRFIFMLAHHIFFFTARDSCPATSPQFSYVDYSSTGAIIAASAGWVGVVVYRRYLSRFNLQSCFTLTLWLHLSVRSLRVLLPLGVYDSAPDANWPFFIVVYCVLGSVTGYMFVPFVDSIWPWVRLHLVGGLELVKNSPLRTLAY